MGTNGISGSYNEFVKSLQAKGLKTTSLGNGEANFADYGNALSGDLKNEILSSIGDESGDQKLQAKIAGLFGSKSVLDSSTIQSKARAAGIKCSVEYKSTSYIVDNKLDGVYDKNVTQGKIAIYTFTDPETGATIKIADANGNGSIEMEEVFMNEILGDVASSIGVNGAGGSNPADDAKARLEALQKELAEKQANIDEIVNNALGIDVTRKPKEDDKQEAKIGETEKVDEKENSDITKTQFEAKVVEEAKKKYAAGSTSIEAVDSVVKNLAKEHPGCDTSQVDTSSLARTVKSEVDVANEKKEKKAEEKEKAK